MVTTRGDWNGHHMNQISLETVVTMTGNVAKEDPSLNECHDLYALMEFAGFNYYIKHISPKSFLFGKDV